jgi:hypothetical protein
MGLYRYIKVRIDTVPRPIIDEAMSILPYAVLGGSRSTLIAQQHGRRTPAFC